MLRWRLWLRFVLLFGAGVLASNALAQAAGERRFQDAEEWARRLDDPSRDAWQEPEEVIRALGLAADAVVADVGAGTGYFAVRLARAVPRGRVYAADIEPEMVRHLRRRAEAEGLANLRVLQATRESPALPEAVDLVLLVNVQGLMVNPGDYFSRLRGSLKPGGRIAVIATRPDTPFGAPPQMRVPADKVKQDMARQGYSLAAEYDFLPNQYFLVFRPQAGSSLRPPMDASTILAFSSNDK